MTDTTDPTVNELVDREVVDSAGDKIGKVHDVYLDNDSGQPEWLAVTSGLFGNKVSFVPLTGASLTGDDVTIAYAKDLVKDAPKVDADGELSPAEEDALYAHYGRSAGTQYATTKAPTAPVGDRKGRDTSGPETDDAMTRSEEELDVNKTTRVAGKARLRKWIETENVQMTVPIRREKARLVTEPITDANRDQALAGANLTSEEHEVTLSEEVVDVSKHVVPKERVRLETDVETEEVAVDEKVRKERIQMENDDPKDTKSR